MSKRSTRVFLSYDRADQDAAQKISLHLSEAGFDVWDPEQQILPGADWMRELKSALDSAEAVIVFISPDSVRSRWVSHEIEYALGARHLRGRLIPVVVQPTTEAPWILNSLRSVRYENPAKTGRQLIDLLTKPADAPQTKSRAS